MRKANEYTKEIAKAKIAKWKKYTKDADEKSIWQIKRYITNLSTSNIISTLNDLLITHQQKADALQKTFFPHLSSADLRDIKAITSYPRSMPYTPQITIQQIRNEVNRAASKKASGLDKISNLVLQRVLSHIEHHLQRIMQATLDLEYFLTVLKETITIVLRKSEKSDYIVSKAYRSIALENTIEKIFESVMTEIISYLTKAHELLSAEHFGE